MSKHSKRVRRAPSTTKNNHDGLCKPGRAAKRMLKSARGWLTWKERNSL